MRVVVLLLAAMVLPAQEPDPLEEARAAYQKGAYAAAQELLDAAWSDAAKLVREDARRYAILKLLSQTQTAAREYDAAEVTLQEAIHWRETVQGRDHPDLLGDLTDLALLTRSRGEPQRGLAILITVLGPLAKLHGSDSNPVADHFAHVSALHMAAKEPEKAASALQHSLRIREKVAGAGHPVMLPDLDRLAAIHLVLRDYPAAAETHLRAIRIRERFLGPMDPDLLANLDGLSYALFGQKDFEAAEPVYLRLLELWEANAGTHHPMVALTLDKLVSFYREWGNEELAELAAARASALRIHFHAAGLAKRAGEWLAAGEKGEAEKLYREAMALLTSPHPALQPLREEIEEQLKKF
jgi:tetratricopeptide (TPR) repeat protein